MNNITHKAITLRTARAVGLVFCNAETIHKIENNELPKGNLFDVARAAGFLGAKATPQLLPHCHPVTIDGMHIQFAYLHPEAHAELFDTATLQRSGIVITGEAQSIGRTGIEMEMLTAVSVAALEIYDMLKPLDKHLEIGGIRLLSKKGGKSDREQYISGHPSCAVLVCSDSCATGEREDKSGKLIQSMLSNWPVELSAYNIVDDNAESIQEQVTQWVDAGIDCIFCTGGTGLGPRDVTTDTLRPMLQREVPGIAEAMRSFGQQRTPLAMLSRSLAGTIGNTLIIALPGSTGGVKESLEAILPAVFHALNMMKGEGH